jgi:hypothetical protein
MIPFTFWEWVLFIAVWSLIPGVFILKAILDARWEKVVRETQPGIDKGIQDIVDSVKK